MLKETLMKDLKVAMREKNKLKKDVITLIRAGLLKLEKESNTELTNEDEIKILRREQKQTKDSLAEYEKAGRDDLVQKEKEKLVIIDAYLPKELSDEALIEMMKTLGITAETNMGQAMGLMMKEVKGRADGKRVKEAVTRFLT